MFTINMDVKHELWEKEIKEFDVPWKILSNLEGVKSDLGHNYNIHGIPQIFLISPEGKILKRGLRGDSMIEYIKSL